MAESKWPQFTGGRDRGRGDSLHCHNALWSHGVKRGIRFSVPEGWSHTSFRIARFDSEGGGPARGDGSEESFASEATRATQVTTRT